MKSLSLVLAVLCLSLVASLDASAKKKSWPTQDPSQESAQDSNSNPSMPECLDGGRSPINGAINRQVLEWKEKTQNQYHDRALIVGKLVNVLQERNSHLHLEVDIGTAGSLAARNESIEIVYNKSFGEVDGFKTGSTVAACGDYITSNAKSGRYEASPVGAIIHWVHASTDPGKHAHGFLIIDGRLYGQKIPQDDRNRQGNGFMEQFLNASGF